MCAPIAGARADMPLILNIFFLIIIICFDFRTCLTKFRILTCIYLYVREEIHVQHGSKHFNIQHPQQAPSAFNIINNLIFIVVRKKISSRLNICNRAATKTRIRCSLLAYIHMINDAFHIILWYIVSSLTIDRLFLLYSYFYYYVYLNSRHFATRKNDENEKSSIICLRTSTIFE